MILFWAICALLMIFALVFVLPPLLQGAEDTKKASDNERRLANIAIYRDQLSELEADLQNGIVSQQQYDQDREEIERRLLEDTSTDTKTKPGIKPRAAVAANKNTAYLLAVMLPLVAIVFYLQVGEPKGIANQPVAQPSSAAGSNAGGERTQAQIEANVEALAKRLQSNPNDAQGWMMLARSYSSMERFGDASGAYAKAAELDPKNADLLAEYAFTTAMANGRTLKGKPVELINQALKIDPENAKALQLLGSAAFEEKDYKKAIEYWQKVLSKVPANSETGQAITSRINEAKSLAEAK